MSPQGSFLRIQGLVYSLFHLIVTWVLAVVMENLIMADIDNSLRSLRFTPQAVTLFTPDTHKSFLQRPVLLAYSSPA